MGLIVSLTSNFRIGWKISCFPEPKPAAETRLAWWKKSPPKFHQKMDEFILYITIVGGFSHLKNISQIGSFPQVAVKIKRIWNHHLDHDDILYLWQIMYAMYNIVASDSNSNNNNTSQVPFLYFHYKSNMENPKNVANWWNLSLLWAKLTEQTHQVFPDLSTIPPRDQVKINWDVEEPAKITCPRDLAFQIKNSWDLCFLWLLLVGEGNETLDSFLHHRVF